MTASISLTTDNFTAGYYSYTISSSVLLRVFRLYECTDYGSVSTDLRGYTIDVAITDSSGDITVTKQPTVIGIPGSICTLTPIEGAEVEGEVLSDDNLESVTLEITYNE